MLGEATQPKPTYMAKEKFNWKALFVNDANASKEKDIEKPVASGTSFPETSGSSHKFPETSVVFKPSFPTSTQEMDNSVLGKIVEMYESGFESLNRPGYDFYEFFKAIKAVGSNDPSMYKMAFTMAKGVDPKISKATLLEQSDFYIKEIDKVHQQYQAKGNSKKDQIQDGLKTKKETLATEIADMEKQIIKLQTDIGKKKNQLQSVDSELLSEVSEVDQKIVANDMAKAKILDTITSVVDGIKNNL